MKRFQRAFVAACDVLQWSPEEILSFHKDANGKEFATTEREGYMMVKRDKDAYLVEHYVSSGDEMVVKAVVSCRNVHEAVYHVLEQVVRAAVDSLGSLGSGHKCACKAAGKSKCAGGCSCHG